MKLPAILLLLACACGGTTSSSDCTIALSGAITDSISCSRVAAEFNGTSGEGGFGVTAAGTVNQFSLAITVEGQPATGTLLPALSNPASIVVSSGSRTWEAVASSSAIIGTFNFTVTDLGSATTIAGNTGWPSVHGTLTATLQPQGSATGTVIVQATF